MEPNNKDAAINPKNLLLHRICRNILTIPTDHLLFACMPRCCNAFCRQHRLRIKRAVKYHTDSRRRLILQGPVTVLGEPPSPESNIKAMKNCMKNQSARQGHFLFVYFVMKS